MRFFAYDGKFPKFMERIFDLVLLQFLWILFSLPVITAGASTTALYTITMKMAKNEESYIIKNFMKAFKDNFQQATKLWGIMVLVTAWLLFMLRICIYGESAILLGIGLCNAGILVITLAGFLYIFPFQAYFDNSLKNIIKNAFICALRYLPYTLGLIAIIGSLILITGFMEQALAFMIFFWIFMGVAFIAFIHSHLLNKVFILNQKHGEEQGDIG